MSTSILWKPAFIVQKEAEKQYKIYYRADGGTTRPVDGGRIYTQRQAAYRKAKQLNDTNNPPYVINCKLDALRDDCPYIVHKLKEMHYDGHITVFDPLYDNEPEVRYILFCRLCRHKEDDMIADTEAYDDLPPLERDYMAWLATVRVEPGVMSLEIAVGQSFKPIPMSKRREP